MSQITECTTVIRKRDERKFVEEMDKEMYVDNLFKAYDDGDVCVYAFDCNGMNPYQIEHTDVEYLFAETNYGEGDLWSSVLVDGGDGEYSHYDDTDETCADYMKETVFKNDIEKFNAFKDSIGYTF